MSYVYATVLCHLYEVALQEIIEFVAVRFFVFWSVLYIMAYTAFIKSIKCFSKLKIFVRNCSLNFNVL
jgi:hypothetical protein